MCGDSLFGYRRWFNCTALALALELALPAISSVAAEADRRPNILFIFSDDHATHALSCYGSRINTTPNLDRIAKSGMLFRNCFCTNSICGPSRAVVLTGKYSHLNGFYGNKDRFNGGAANVPQTAAEGGIRDGA